MMVRAKLKVHGPGVAEQPRIQPGKFRYTSGAILKTP